MFVTPLAAKGVAVAAATMVWAVGGVEWKEREKRRQNF